MITAYFSAALTLAVGIVLLASGVAHGRNLAELRLALADRGYPAGARMLAPLAPLVPAGHLCLGAMVVLAEVFGLGNRSGVLIAGALWFGVLSLDLLRTRVVAPWAPCGCPGSKGPIDTVHIGRAVVLSGLCVWLAAQEPSWRSFTLDQQAVVLLNAVSMAVLALLLSLVKPERSPLRGIKDLV